MTALELLIAMRELLSVEERWTKKVVARNEHGVVTRPDAVDACSWCMMGAAMKLCGDLHIRHVAYVIIADGDVDAVNDSSTHAEVLALLDAAIERARAV